MPLDLLVKLNGRTLTDLAVNAMPPSPNLGFAGVDRGRYPIPKRYGVSADPISVGREKIQNFRLVLPATTDITAQQAALDALLKWLDGLIEIELGTATDRVQWGLLDDVPIRALFEQLAMIDGDATLDLRFLVEAGHSVGKALRTLGLSTTFTDVLNLGELPSEPRVFMRGPATTPVIEYARHDGTVLSSVVTGANIASGKWWEFDSRLDRIIEGTDSTGARTDVTSTAYSSGSFPVLDRGDGTEFLPPLIRASHAAIAYYKSNYASP